MKTLKPLSVLCAICLARSVSAQLDPAQPSPAPAPGEKSGGKLEKTLGILQTVQTNELTQMLIEVLRGATPKKRQGEAQNPSQTSGRFSGRFQGDGLVLDSQLDQDRYTGTIQLGENGFRFAGVERNNELQGVFESKDGQFDFKATLNNGQLNLTTGGTRYQLARQNLNPLAGGVQQTSRNPLAGGRPAGEQSFGAGALSMTGRDDPSGSTPNWRNIYRNSSGASFRYPDSWQVREDANLRAVVLVPNDGSGGGETMMVTGVDAGGVTTADDPRVLQGVEAVVLQYFPTLRRAGDPQPISAGARPGMQFTWEGADFSGNVTRVRVYSAVLGRYTASLSAFGPRDQVAAREGIMRQIFATFDISGGTPGGVAGPVSSSGYGGAASGLDSRLASGWVQTEYNKITGYWKEIHAALRPDGSAFFSYGASGGQNFQLKNGQGVETGRGSVGSEGSTSMTGRWQTSGDTLTITLSSGQRTNYRYNLGPDKSGHTMLYLHPSGGGQVQLWSKE